MNERILQINLPIKKEKEAIFISIFKAVCFGPKMNNIYDILF